MLYGPQRRDRARAGDEARALSGCTSRSPGRVRARCPRPAAAERAGPACVGLGRLGRRRRERQRRLPHRRPRGCAPARGWRTARRTAASSSRAGSGSSPRTSSASAADLQPKVTVLQITGILPPFDGCELASSGGHRWPDRFGSHAPVELPLTEAGRRYFADRAAARDLALFVRSGAVQRIRREPGPQLERDLRATFGDRLARSRIRYRLTADGVRFWETSPTGKRLEVVVEHGRIARHNLEPYTSVH